MSSSSSSCNPSIPQGSETSTQSSDTNTSTNTNIESFSSPSPSPSPNSNKDKNHDKKNGQQNDQENHNNNNNLTDKDRSVANKDKVKNSRKIVLKVPRGTRDCTAEQMTIREKSFSIITEIFKRHGAVSIDTPVFELKETLIGKYGEDSKLIYDLADQGGELCALRYDLTVPFARFVAEHGIENIKRYQIGRVYRRDNPAIERGRYREFFQMDFDVCGIYPPMVPDAEVLKVLSEILSALPFGGKFKIKINHRKLLDGMLQVCGVPVDKYRTICSSIDKLDKEEWRFVKSEMVKTKGLDEKVADAIGLLVSISGDPLVILSQLHSLPHLMSNVDSQLALKDLELLFSYLSCFGCLDKFSFDLSLARGLDYYTGCIYEAVLTSSESKVGSIAAGGRYDNLVGMFSGKQIPAVGVSIGIERIFSLIEEEERKRGNIKKNDTHVLIAQLDNGLIMERMKLAQMLWDHGIHSEIQYIIDPDRRKQIDYCVKNGIPIIVWVGSEEEKSSMVKVKLLEKKEEFTVEKGKLIPKLQEEIAFYKETQGKLTFQNNDKNPTETETKDTETKDKNKSKGKGKGKEIKEKEREREKEKDKESNKDIPASACVSPIPSIIGISQEKDDERKK